MIYTVYVNNIGEKYICLHIYNIYFVYIFSLDNLEKNTKRLAGAHGRAPFDHSAWVLATPRGRTAESKFQSGLGVAS